MLIFLASLQGIPKELYESADIDGAGSWGKFQFITVPSISPVILFNTVLGVIGALQMFTAGLCREQRPASSSSRRAAR